MRRSAGEREVVLQLDPSEEHSQYRQEWPTHLKKLKTLLKIIVSIEAKRRGSEPAKKTV